MRLSLKSLWHAAQWCTDYIVLFACWALWIALGGFIVVQLVVSSSRELAVPDFVLRSLEERFTASHINARFGRATFNPTGGVLLENVSLSLPEFNEPIVNARAVFVELDPWLLLAGKLEARRVHATGVDLSMPAMLTPSGRSEEILSSLEFTIAPKASQLDIDHLTARIAGIALQVHGSFHLLPSRTTGAVAPLPLIENLAQNYSSFCRQLIRAANQLSSFEQPELRATLIPSTIRGAFVDLSLTARRLKLPGLRDLDAQELRLSLSLPLLGDEPTSSPLTFTADELRTSDGAVARRVQARVLGSLNLAQLSYLPKEIELTCDEVSARGFSLHALSSQIEPSSSSSRWNAALIALCFGSPLAVNGRVDVAEKTADLRVQGALAPTLLEPIGVQIGTDVRRFIGFGKPLELDVDVRFKPDWKFERLAGRIVAREVDAYHVPIDWATGEIEFDGRHFLAHDAVAALGENLARGSFEQDLSTLEFRFLLEGHLRPLEIGGWFGTWWPDFFQNFEFPSEPPNASVDVAGRWLAGNETTVFVFAESKSPAIRGTTVDYARTLMFIRPNFFEGLEFFATRGSGEVRGTFARHIDLIRHDWSKMTFALDSTLDLATGAGLLGPELAERLDPFTFANAPHIKAEGHFDGPAAPGGVHQAMQINAKSTGAFSIYKFPVHDASFDATLRDDELLLEHVEAKFAGGTLSGHGRLSGPDNQRKLGFDATLHEARLSEAVTAVSDYAAQRRGQPTTAEKFMPGKSQIKFDLALAAEGRFDDLFSYQGTGNAVLNGAELGEVRLLGLLSELFDFTALRFTTARLNFQLQGRKVFFPTLSVTGANSAIEGHGDYWLDRGEMDFNARVYPFQESKSLLQNVVGVVLTPLSTALEVKLTGPLNQPSWAFVIGPTNFLRSLTQPSKPAAEKPPADTPSTYLKR